MISKWSRGVVEKNKKLEIVSRVFYFFSENYQKSTSINRLKIDFLSFFDNVYQT